VKKWFQAFAFQMQRVPLYTAVGRKADDILVARGRHGGAVQVESSLTHSLKAPGFNPSAYEVKKLLSKAFAFKFKLYRYTTAAPLRRWRRRRRARGRGGGGGDGT
jgi:hypothetical protein